MAPRTRVGVDCGRARGLAGRRVEIRRRAARMSRHVRAHEAAAAAAAAAEAWGKKSVVLRWEL